MYIIGIAVVFILWRLVKRSGDEPLVAEGVGIQDDTEPATWDGIQIDREWWPRMGRFSHGIYVDVDTSNPELIRKQTIELVPWSSEWTRNDNWFLRIKQGKVFVMPERPRGHVYLPDAQARIEAGLIFARWDLKHEYYKVFDEDSPRPMFRMRIEFFELTMPFPMSRSEGHPFYFPRSVWDELRAEFESKPSRTVAIGSLMEAAIDGWFESRSN